MEIPMFKAWASSFQIYFCIVLNMILVGIFFGHIIWFLWYMIPKKKK